MTTHKKLNDIIGCINLDEFSKYLVPVSNNVVPSITIVDSDDGGFNLNLLTELNTFLDDKALERFVVFRYAVDSKFAEKIVNDTDTQFKFVLDLIANIDQSLQKLVGNKVIRLTQMISFKMPGLEDFIRMRENGDFELRACFKILL